MIIKRKFSPARVLPYARREATHGLLSGAVAYALVVVAGFTWLQLPSTIAVVLGTALAILLGFRANSAYQRWWDAATSWMQIVAASRNLARIVIALGNAKKANTQFDAEAIGAWQRRMVRRQIGWAHALRLQLREQEDREEIAAYLTPEEATVVRTADAPTVLLLQMHSQDIYRGYTQGFFMAMDNFQMEQILPLLAQHQAALERIKQMSIPRPYAAFASGFVLLYVLVFPLAIIGSLQPDQSWLVLPLGLVVGTVFSLVERTATASEDPFENRAQDVPLTAICNTIERDLLEQLGEPERPQKTEPVEGYLW